MAGVPCWHHYQYVKVDIVDGPAAVETHTCTFFVDPLAGATARMVVGDCTTYAAAAAPTLTLLTPGNPVPLMRTGVPAGPPTADKVVIVDCETYVNCPL